MMSFQISFARLKINIVVLFFITTGFSQNNVDYLSWFDQKVGSENTALFNGYYDDSDGERERTRSFDGSQRYFKKFDFYIGSITYENQDYNKIEIKYDVFEDELLLNLKSSQERWLKIRPIRERVQGFILNGHTFVNLMNFRSLDASYSGFGEIIYKGSNFTLLIKHNKIRSENIVERRITYKYRDANAYLLFYKGDFHPVKREKDFINLFPEYKNEMREYKINRATMISDMLNYIRRLNLLISKK